MNLGTVRSLVCPSRFELFLGGSFHEVSMKIGDAKTLGLGMDPSPLEK